MKEGQGGTVGAQRRSQICLPLPKILDPAHAQERGREWGSLNMGHPGSKSGDIRTRISGLPNQRTFREQEGSPQSRQHCTQIETISKRTCGCLRLNNTDAAGGPRASWGQKVHH